MDFITKMKTKAKADLRTVILVENEDERVIKAAVAATEEKLAKIILLGTKEESQAVCPEADLSGIEFMDAESDPKFNEYVEQFYELRKHKGIDMDFAEQSVKDKTTFGMMLLKNDIADGLVSGAVNSTANTLRPALQILRTKPGATLVSSFFVMDTGNKDLGEDGVFLFADCALNEFPNSEQLADIAIASAESFKFFVGDEPRVAMLSYSSFGSAKSDATEKVVEATKIAQEKAPELILDGELQLDAAVKAVTSAKKAPGNKVEGKANILVFPDINAGNIGYKLVQHLGGAVAIGPILQGIAKPVNDLSRGCSAEDIIGVIAVTAVQSAAENN